MFKNSIIRTVIAAAIATATATTTLAQGYIVQDGYYDYWGSWVDTSYYVEQSYGYGYNYGTGGGAGYYDAWGQWNATSNYGHAANMGAIADFGASSMSNYQANSAASDARQADIISGIWE